MSKAKKLAVFGFILMVVLVLVSVNINAEEVVEEVAEEASKTTSAIWFEDNLGWFVGIPSGLLLSIVGDIVVLYKKNRSYAKDMMSNEKTRTGLNKFCKDVIENTKQIENYVAETKQQVVVVVDKVDKTVDKIEELTNKVESVAHENKVVAVNVNKLIEVIALMVSTDEKYVSNGIAEKINALIENK